MSFSSGTPERASEKDEDEIFDWQSLDTTSTIVKLRKGGKGETPLIVIHGVLLSSMLFQTALITSQGVAGSIIHFKPFQENFKSALWAIQITPDTPLTSMQEQAAFYHTKIKVSMILQCFHLRTRCN